VSHIRHVSSCVIWSSRYYSVEYILRSTTLCRHCQPSIIRISDRLGQPVAQGQFWNRCSHTISRHQCYCICSKGVQTDRLYYADRGHICKNLWNVHNNLGHAAGGAGGWGTALQTGRPRVRVPLLSLKFFTCVILTAELWLWGWLSI